MTRAAVLRSAVALVVIALLVPSASVAKKKRKKIVWHHYAVPFTCGVNAADTARVVPGTYAVSMDLHNASAGDATLIQYLALTFPPGGIAAGVASEARQDVLPAGVALQISCAELMGSDFDFRGSPPASPYIQGVLVIESSVDLTVGRTQTATGATGEVSVDVERIPARVVSHKVLVCHDPSDPHTISIAAPAWRAHQAHGDTLGACL